MFNLKSVLFCCCVAVLLHLTTSKSVSEDGTISVQATNFTSVPSVVYIVDAVECLEEAYKIYETDEERATLYAALFEEKHNGTWNVVVGYTAVYVQSKIYIEAAVTGGGKKNLKKDSSTETLFLIFSSE